MKKSLPLALLVCGLFAIASATVEAVPITLSLDMPNQSVAAPSSGVVTLNFSGTLTTDTNYQVSSTGFDFPFNASQSNFLLGNFDSAFINFIISSGTGTYTGNFFSIDVPAGTPADLYAFQQFSGNPSLFSVTVIFVGNVADGEPSPTQASQAFSVLVTDGFQVPEGGSGVALLGLSVAGLFLARRVRA